MRNCHNGKETVYFTYVRIHELYEKLLLDDQLPLKEVILNGVGFDRRTVDSKKSVDTAAFTLRDSGLFGFRYKRAKLLLMLNENEVRLMLESEY